jgi:hypothetical protein
MERGSVHLSIQDLLDKEAWLSNNGQGDSEERMKIHTLIRLRRDENVRPDCFGDDDCSTRILSMCPWRMDCGN